MQTQRESLKENVELNLVDICWKLLMQWRPIIVFSLLMALAVSGLKYYKDVSAYKASVQTVKEQKTKKTSYTEKDIEKLKDKLSDTELNAVETAVFNQRKILTDQKYLDSSILMQIDSQNKHVVYIDYYISGLKPKFSELLCRSFSSRFYDRDVLQKLSKTMNEDIDSADLQKVMGELINVDYSGTTQSVSTATGDGYQVSTEVYPVITVSVVLPSDTDSTAVVKAVNSSMKSISKDLNKSVGKHRLNFLESYDKYTVDNDLKDTQNRVKDEILSSQSANATAVDSFTEDQKCLYKLEVINLKDEMGIDVTENSNEKLSKTTNLTELSDDETTDSSTGDSKSSEDSLIMAKAEKPSFLIKYFVIGFVIGLFIYIVCYIIFVALRNRVNSGDEIADVTRLRKFGEYHAYTKTGFARFIWSKLIYEVYYRKYLSIEETSKYAADGINASIKLMKNVNVTSEIVSTVPLKNDAEAKRLSLSSGIDGDNDNIVTILSLDTFTHNDQEFISALSKTLTGLGITVVKKQLNIEQILTDAEVIKSLGTVVLVVTYNHTNYSELDALLEIIKKYCLSLLGYVYVD